MLFRSSENLEGCRCGEADGGQALDEGAAIHPPVLHVTDHRTPFEERWGGWYVTGTHGKMKHLGNAVAPNPYRPIELETKNTQNQTSLAGKFDITKYLTPTSDLIALMTLEHQTRALYYMAAITEQFRATFAQLEGAFARRFEQLFDGGEAQLTLTAPDDLGSTGVEITARPPGKRRQPLAMLSGGERALTAVALLLAMLEVRPVPFCVLDEVDAALDEAPRHQGRAGEGAAHARLVSIKLIR